MSLVIWVTLTAPKSFICNMAQNPGKKLQLPLDNKVLNCYYQINTDSIPGGESPPTANPSECRPRITRSGAIYFLGAKPRLRQRPSVVIFNEIQPQKYF